MNATKKNTQISYYVDWAISPICNYQCSYCLSAKKSASFVDLIDSRSFVEKFKKYFSPKWQFNISGTGEPFLAKNFLEAIQQLINNDYKINTLFSNFSAPTKEIVKFCEIVSTNINQLHASLHLESVQVEAFISKIITVKKICKGRLIVEAVADKKNLLLLDEIGEYFNNIGVQFNLQIKKIYFKKGFIFEKYNKKEKLIIKKYRESGLPNAKDLKIKGYSCDSGLRYVLVDSNGDVWHCHPAKRAAKKDMYLGNILNESVKLKQNPVRCPFKYCWNPIPVIFGIIPSWEKRNNDI